MRRPTPVPIALLGLVGLVGVGLVGCSPQPAPTQWVTVTPEVIADKSLPPEPIDLARWPLTGVETDDLAQRAAVSVKIENSPAARPQVGLQRADIVWEQLVEGGMTRFVAVYHSDLPEDVGPIRSIRPMDAAIAGPAGGVLAFSGGQGAYQREATGAGLVLVSDDGGGPGFYRNQARRGDHSLFGDPTVFVGQAGDAAPPPEIFAHSDAVDSSSAATDGREASHLLPSFPSSRPSWSWQDEAWARAESGSPATDEGEQITAANVVVLSVRVRDTGNRDAAGARVLETILTGSGEAVVLSGGHAIDGTWHKDGPADVPTLTDEEGEVLLLSPGNTWVELVPVMGGTITVS